MSVAQLTRSIRFSAAHRYYRAEWSEAENRRRFGACANEHGHGHNYVAQVTIAGRIDEETGFCVDLAVLDALLREQVGRLDHQHLNHAVPEFGAGGAIPTTENIARHLWRCLADSLPAGASLVRLRLHEDHDLYVDYFGEEVGAGAARGAARP
jgi:6-pyruvoyltetrahydropterin/6-carboxytetrahydropterin synthase